MNRCIIQHDWESSIDSKTWNLFSRLVFSLAIIPDSRSCFLHARDIANWLRLDPAWSLFRPRDSPGPRDFLTNLLDGNTLDTFCVSVTDQTQTMGAQVLGMQRHLDPHHSLLRWLRKRFPLLMRRHETHKRWECKTHISPLVYSVELE
jgi:hypothetical protein